MNVWRNWGVEDYEWVMGIEKQDRAALSEIYDLRLSGSWPDVRVELVHEDQGKRFKEADFPWCGTTIVVLRSRILPIVEDLLLKHGELLPLACDDAELLAYNCTTVVDALDPDQTRLKLFPSSGRLMRIERHVFVPERLAGIDVFRLPQFDKGGPIYFSDAFRRRVLDAGLTGLGFQLKWSTDPTLPISDSW